MGSGGGDCGAFAELVVFLSYFRDLPDLRQPGKVEYRLSEVLLLLLLATIAGADCIVEVARFGQKKRDLLRRFRPFADGTPSHDKIGDILASLHPQAFQRCFVAWVASLTGVEPDLTAIDGKTSRRLSGKKGGGAPAHMVSAFAARQRLVLGQVKVADKSNEIVAIPKLLAMLDIENAIVTIDAMGCHGMPARHRPDHHRQEGRLHPGPQGKPGHPARRRRALRRRVERKELQGRDRQPQHGRGRRSRPHREKDHHRHPSGRMAPQSWMARTEKHHRGRQPMRDRRQDPDRDAALHHLTRLAGPRRRSARPLSLGDREEPALGHGHGLPR